MNWEPNQHGPEILDWLFLYVMSSLPSAEMAKAEAHIASCRWCREKIETLSRSAESVAASPDDILRPSPSLWERLTQQIAKETGQKPPSPSAETPDMPEWEEAAPGISAQLLASDVERQRISMLVRLAPGIDYPPHCHAGVEEVYLLAGVLNIDDKTLYPGDWIRSEPNSVDHRVWSETGCTCLIITSTNDQLL